MTPGTVSFGFRNGCNHTLHSLSAYRSYGLLDSSSPGHSCNACLGVAPDMTRTGKIARLPHYIRELLNRRLRDGGQGKTLVQWLNGVPDVKEALEDEFGGRAINEQNLSEWKQGGFAEWQRHQEDRAWVQQLAEQAGELGEDAGNFSVSDQLSVLLALVLGRTMRALAARAGEDPDQIRLFLEALREVSMQRRCDHSAQRLRLQQERWEAAQEAKEKAEMEQVKADIKASEHRIAVYGKILREEYENKKKQGALSSDEEARYQKIFANLEEEAREQKLFAKLDERPRRPPMRSGHGGFEMEPDQAESNSIKPNQNRKYPGIGWQRARSD